MMTKSARFVFAGAAVIALAACGGGAQVPVESPENKVAGRRAEDQSKCAYEGRDDRDVSESSAPGAVVANVRRVYGYTTVGDERRRVLLCREVDTNLDGVKDLVRTYGDDGQKLSELADADYDGKIDTWISYTGTRIGKLELDTNADGKPDEVRYYVGGKLTRVQRDSNADQKPDLYEVYREGRLERIGVDANFDGQVDRWDRDELRAAEEAPKPGPATKAEEKASAPPG